MNPVLYHIAYNAFD